MKTLIALLVATSTLGLAQQRSALDSGANPQVTVERDIAYAGTDNPRQTLDLILPKKRKSDEPLPVVAFVHGGAWRAGDKRSGIGRLAPIIGGGDYAGVSIAYRLSAEAQWPAQSHDCKAAIRWIRAHAKQYKLDPDKIAVWGTSAGGHLVAMLGVSGGVEQLEGKLGSHLDQSSRVSCVINFFGPSNLLTMGDHPSSMDHNAPGSPESLLVGGAIQENKALARAASPATYITRDDAPLLNIHGTSDKLVPYPQSVEFNRALIAAGVASNLITVEGGGHGNFGKAAPELDQIVRQFLSLHLIDGDGPEMKDRRLQAR